MGPPVSLALVQIPQSLLDLFTGGALHGQIDGGMNVEPFPIKRLFAVFLGHVLPDVLCVERRLFDEPVAPRLDVPGFVAGLFRLLLRYIALLGHARENVELPLSGPFRETMG